MAARRMRKNVSQMFVIREAIFLGKIDDESMYHFVLYHVVSKGSIKMYKYVITEATRKDEKQKVLIKE